MSVGLRGRDGSASLRSSSTYPPHPYSTPNMLRSHALLACTFLVAACGGGASDRDTTVGADTTANVAADSAAAVAGSESPAAAPAADASAGDRSTHRPADVSVSFGGDKMYAGSYHAAAVSRLCGTTAVGLPGEDKAFLFEFPYEGEHEISDVSFSAPVLTAGSSTSNFHLTVSLKNKEGGKPPALAFRAGDPKSSETGTASLAAKGDTSELHVTAKNNYGSLDMTVRCAPKAP